MIDIYKALVALKEKVLELLVMNSKITCEEAMDYIEKYWQDIVCILPRSECDMGSVFLKAVIL